MKENHGARNLFRAVSKECEERPNVELARAFLAVQYDVKKADQAVAKEIEEWPVLITVQDIQTGDINIFFEDVSITKEQKKILLLLLKKGEATTRKILEKRHCKTSY
ncbi:MAG: hypothetical protein ABIH48_02500 [Candidatus Falkowbacteria bacterium]